MQFNSQSYSGVNPVASGFAQEVIVTKQHGSRRSGKNGTRASNRVIASEMTAGPKLRPSSGTEPVSGGDRVDVG